MTKQTKNVPALQGDAVEQITNQSENAPTSYGGIEAILESTANVDLSAKERSISVTPKYFELKLGESIKGAYCGIRNLNFVRNEIDDTTGEMVRGGEEKKAVLIAAKGAIHYNTGAQLVTIAEQSNLPLGTLIEIAYNDNKRTTGGGSLKIYDIYLLK